jgi:uncharacterized membrane protein
MNKALKILHLIGLALFLGSIPGHILLGQLAAGAVDPGQLAQLLRAKYLATAALTLPGLTIMVISGAVLLARRRELLRSGWMRAKLASVALVVVNSVFVMLPVAAEITKAGEAALGGAVVADQLAALDAREDLFGAINLLMILAIISLSVVRPRRRLASPVIA